jgi:PucR-like helix-turn-helix protein/diguanylate cyclase with GGDEF domain
MNAARDAGDLDREISRLAEALLGRLDELAAAMAQRVRAEVSFYVDLALVPYDDLRKDCHAQLNAILPTLGGSLAADTAYAVQSGRQRATDGIPLPKVMDSYRVSGRFIWETLVAEAQRTGAMDSAALVRAASKIWLILDSFTQAMATAYRDVVTERIVAHEHERSALVAALLDGRITDDQTLWESAEALGISRRGPFVVVAAELAHVGRQALPEVDARLRAQDLSSAWRLLPDLQVGIVVLPDHKDAPDRLVAVLDRQARGRIGVSPPYPSLDGTRTALRFAKIAMSGVRSTGPKVIVFDKSPLAVTAASTPEVMARIVGSVLGPLDRFPAAERATLLDTLEAWRDSGGSTEQAAATLFCHPNTVRHRLRRITEATGRGFTAPQDIAELCLALEAARQQPR